MQELTRINSTLEQYIKTLDVRENSKILYVKALKQFFIYLDKNSITQPKEETIINYKKFLLERVKPNTAQVYLIAVKLFFKWLSSKGLYLNIAGNIKGVKINGDHKKDALTQTQARKLLQSINTSNLKGLRDYCILSLMLTAGIRTVEVTRANIEDLKFVSGQLVLFVQGKGRDEKSEYIKIADDIAAKIKKYLSLRKDENNALFVSVKSKDRLTTKAIRETAKNYLRLNGLTSDRLSAHSLRHTAATIALLNGVDIRQVQQLLRHSSINTTLIYTHDLDRLKNNSELVIANAIL